MFRVVSTVSEQPRYAVRHPDCFVQHLTASSSSAQHKTSLPLESISDLRCKYDFSKVHAHLVSSLSGKFEGWPEVVRVGHPRLMKVVMDIGAKPQPGWEIALECQVSWQLPR